MTTHPSQSNPGQSKPTPPKPSPTAFLDGLRGLAAFYVLLHHARYLLHEGSPYGFQLHPERYSAFSKAVFYALSAFRYGHEGVLFFFVLSGFVIHLRYAREFAADPARAKFGYVGYVYRRAKRLYPPMLLALLLTFALDSAGAAKGYAIYSAQTPYLNINATLAPPDAVVPGPDLRATTLLGNLAFTMGVYVRTYGSDGPLWSLMYEWWFYMFFPLFWWVTRRSIPAATALMAALVLGSAHPEYWPLKLPQQVMTMMGIWWMGVLLAEVYAGRIQAGRIRVPMAALAPLVLLLPASVAWVLPDTCWALGFVGLIASGFAWQQRDGSLWVLHVLKPLGDMSYTLYVCHMPILVFLAGWLMSRSPTGHLPEHFGYLLPCVGGILLFAWLAHFVVEWPFTRPTKKKVSAPQTAPN
ncbi:MAG: acyltransferase [Planctomycetota bacterium]|nr:acyltransferase [Planctomycetota bacterium]